MRGETPSIGGSLRVAMAAGKFKRSAAKNRRARTIAVRLPAPARERGRARLAPDWNASQTRLMHDAADTCAAAAEGQSAAVVTSLAYDEDDCGGGWRRLDDPYGGLPYWHNVRTDLTTWERPYGAFDEEGGRAATRWKRDIAPAAWPSTRAADTNAMSVAEVQREARAVAESGGSKCGPKRKSQNVASMDWAARAAELSRPTSLSRLPPPLMDAAPEPQPEPEPEEPPPQLEPPPEREPSDHWELPEDAIVGENPLHDQWYYADADDSALTHGPFARAQLQVWLDEGHFSEHDLIRHGAHGADVMMNTVLTVR